MDITTDNLAKLLALAEKEGIGSKAMRKRAADELTRLGDVAERKLMVASRDGWFKNDDGYVVWRVIERTEDGGEPVKMIEYGTNPYHRGGGWSTDVDILLGKKVRTQATIGELLILDWAKAILDAKGEPATKAKAKKAA